MIKKVNAFLKVDKETRSFKEVMNCLSFLYSVHMVKIKRDIIIWARQNLVVLKGNESY